MKKLITAFVIMALFSSQAFCVAVEKVAPTSVTFFNFSGSPYSLAGHLISIGLTFSDVSAWTVVGGGSTTVPAGGSLTLEGGSIPTSMGSVGLWAPGTNTSTPTGSDLIDYVQYGGVGNPFEALAIAAFLWQSNTFAPSLPISRTDANLGTGNGTFESDNPTGIEDVLLSNAIHISPNPFYSNVTVTMEPEALNKGDYTYEVVDMAGRTLISQVGKNERTLTITADQLPKGAYIIRIQSEDGALVNRRLLKL